MAGDIQETVRERLEQARARYHRFRGGFTAQQESLFQLLLFLVLFTLLAAPFYLILSSGWEAEGLRAFTAELSAAVLHTTGLEVTSSGSFVRTENLLLDVTRDSTGWKSVTVFTALVLAARRSLRSTITAVVIGSLLLIGLNILRITSMVYAVTVYGVNYEVMHTLLWRWGLTAGVITLWAVWMYVSASSPGFIRSRR